jgi:UDP-N-acetylglucosamine 2-epimerase
MRKKKILTVVGTRPEIIRLSSIIKKLDKCFDHYLVHTNQNYDYNLKDVFFKDFNIKPKYIFEINSKNVIENVSKILVKVDQLIKKIKPDAFLILGDTNSSLSAITAKKNKIPIFHIEAGNRCFNDIVPEEINRRIVDHISDINLTYSDFARNNLLNEGLKPDRIFKIGSPLYEVINQNRNKIKINFFLKKNKLKKNQFFLLSFHREENIENKKKLYNFFQILKNLEKSFNIPILVSTHPRLKKLLNNEILKSKNIFFHKPFNYFEYLSLQLSAKAIISDSGSITEEAAILKVPAISLREDIERQEGMDEASVLLSKVNYDELYECLNILFQTYDNKFPKEPTDYKVENVSDKVVRIIQSYISFINTNTWKKNLD